VATEAELEAVVRTLIEGGESYYVEFKTAWNFGPDGKQPRELKSVAKDIGEALVAFANSDGGDLIVGVEDTGAITGIPWEADRLAYLVQAPRAQVRDVDLGARVYDVKIDGYSVLLFRVDEHTGSTVVTADGRCLWRKGATSEPVRPDEIERRRRHRLGDTSYEAEPVPTAALDDIEIPPELLARKSHPRLSDIPTLLRYWNLTEGRNGHIILKRAALLLFAKDPLRWHPNNRLRIRRAHEEAEGYGSRLMTREIEILGPICKIIPQSRHRLRQTLEVEARTNDLFTTTQVLPAEAVDECIVNAAAHRNYAIEGSAIEVVMYPDRVEFKSPGRLPEPLTIEDLVRRQGAHRSRNPIIMRVMRDLGWSRDQGEGMRRIFGAMSQVELNEPEIEQRADTFIVRLSTRSRYDQETQAWIAAYGPFGLEPQERKYVVELNKHNLELSVDRLARVLGESFDKTKGSVVQLEKRGIVWHAPRSRTYHLVPPLSVPQERAFRRLRQMRVKIDASTLLDVNALKRILGAPDSQSTTSGIDRWRESGILVPAGKGNWKLGQSILEYSRGRIAAER